MKKLKQKYYNEFKNDFLCTFRKKINEANNINPKILNNLLTNLLTQINLTNLNPLEEKELKTVNKNPNHEIVLRIIERFNDINDETNWEKFQNNHKYRFTKDGDYIEVPNQEPRRFKETINILRDWINTKLDLYNQLLTNYFNNEEMYKQLTDFDKDLKAIIFELQNIEKKLMVF